VDCIFTDLDYFKLQVFHTAIRHGVAIRRPLGLFAVPLIHFLGTIIMTEHSLWRFSRALHRAINDRQFGDLEDLIDDDVDWAIYGPIDMFPCLGARRGKAAVLEALRQIADNIRVHRFDREQIMLGEGRRCCAIR
jgi:hypothetical protein